jgi:hypothetical protein
MQTSIDGLGVSADTEDIAETVVPARPPGPSVVTTLTVVAVRLIASRKLSRKLALIIDLVISIEPILFLGG